MLFKLIKSTSYLSRCHLSRIPTIMELRAAMERHVASTAQLKDVKQFDPNVSHPPSASASQCVIPLSSGNECQIRYMNASGHARSRFGMILEDLDMFAVWLAFRHNQPIGMPMGTPGHHPMIIVTACVDDLKMKNKVVRSDLDILMEGKITWVGRSSLEATMTLKQKYSESDWRDILTAKFVMVSQDPRTWKSARNVPLKIETEEDRLAFEEGEHAKNQRISREKNSLLKTVPTEEERTILHNLFLRTIDEKSHTFERRLPVESVWMHEAKLKNSIICFPLKRNLYGKIFGGYLMRVAFETAWACATVLSKTRTRVTEVDNIMFRRPVEVGSLLLLNSQVCYSTPELMQVSVDAQVLDLETGKKELTNTFQFTFENEEADKKVPIVLPRTYEDGILYLNGRRHALNT